MRLRSTILLMIAMVIAIGALGVGYAWSTTPLIDTTVSTGNIGLEFTGFECSDIPGQPDMGQTTTAKDVASAECTLVDSDGDNGYDTLRIAVDNAYPGFQMMVSNVTIQGFGSVPVHITDTSFDFDDFDGGDGALVMDLEGFWTDSNLVCLQVHAGDTISGNFWLHLSVFQPAIQDHTYTFTLNIESAQWNETDCGPADEDLGGTPGFWKNWDSHNTYASSTIQGWLAAIDTASEWLGPGPTDIDDMESTLDFSNKAPMEDKFLGHYLATRLNAESGRLALIAPHDVSALDAGDFVLGLADSSAASISEIITAIELKFGTGPEDPEYPTDDEFEVMKDVCDALNNLLL